MTVIGFLRLAAASTGPPADVQQFTVTIGGYCVAQSAGEKVVNGSVSSALFQAVAEGPELTVRHASLRPEKRPQQPRDLVVLVVPS